MSSDSSPQQEGMEAMESRYRPRGDGRFLCPAGFPVPSGTEEWTLIPGPKGDKGAKGERGEQGESHLPFRLAWAIVVLFAIAAVFAIGGVFLGIHETQVNQAAEHRASQAIERKLCATLNQLAALKPPSGNPVQNPSRKYDDSLHATLSQLRTDLGCKP